MDYWHDISPGENIPNEVAVVVEIPKGSQNKYEFDKEHNVFTLDRVLFSPIHYPGDYGIVPQTLADDGDPLDALVMVTYPTYPGILITARPIGILRMLDSGEADDKILCVPVNDIRMEHINNVSDIQQPIREEIAHFFEVYKQLEGKEVKLGGWDETTEAHRVIMQARAQYIEKFGQQQRG